MLALRSRRVVTPRGVREATVLIREGRIAGIEPFDAPVPAEYTLEDWGNAVLSPGLVDAHVHINEPGRTEWEGFLTATRAAVAGGVTTLAEMPLNASPVTTTVAAWREKMRATTGKLFCDCGFYGGLVPGNTEQIEPLLDAGALGIKAFLVHSGLDEFPAAREEELRAAMPILAHRDAVLLVHAELEGEAGQNPPAPRGRSYAHYLTSRPAAWEEKAIAWMIELCREYGCRVHIVHLSAAGALPMIRAARAEGLPLTVETAPHYLFFAAEQIEEGATTFKCAPPIREADNREALWEALRDGTIDFVASDHSPCPPALKNLESGEFGGAWGGISSLQWTLSILWSQGRQRGCSLEEVARWTASNPARLLGLESRKGSLAAGCDADLVVWDPEGSFTVTEENNQHRHKLTPYTGEELWGRVQATYLRGQRVELSAGAPRGQVLVGEHASGLGRLNLLPGDEARAELLRCCGSATWAEAVLNSRPFPDEAALRTASESAFDGLSEADWREAFAHHPKLGDLDSLRQKFAATRAWAGSEQAGTQEAPDEVLRDLAEGNRLYEQSFGFIFILCATGKSARDMLAALRARLFNDAETEMVNAAQQQKLITGLRLAKLLCGAQEAKA